MVMEDVPAIEQIFTDALEWLSSTGLKIGIVLLVVAVVRHFGMMIASRAVHHAIERGSFTNKHDVEQRANTILSMVEATSHFLSWLVGGAIIFYLLGVDLAALIAGAGAAAIAIGLGAQAMIKDISNGIFIVLENQYRVGDVVKIAGVDGVVSKITLRETVLRDLDGHVHHVPNGLINVATNLTMEYANLNLNISVSYDADIDKVTKVINEVGQAMAKDEDWAKHIIDPPEFLRVDNFADSAVEVKVVAKVRPSQQWALAGEYRKRIKVAFEKAGIEIPYPQRIIHQPKRTAKKS